MDFLLPAQGAVGDCAGSRRGSAAGAWGADAGGVNAGQAGRMTADDLRVGLQARVDQGYLSRFGMPENMQLVGALAGTSVGKRNKRAMREQLAR